MVYRIPKVKRSGEQKKIRDHYIPEFYLNEFSISETGNDSKPSVWMYDIDNPIPKKISTSNVAKIKNYYDKIVDDVLTDLESITAPIFRSLRNTDVEFTNIQDRYNFGKFICFLTFRTPQFQQHFDTLVQNTIKTKIVKQFNEKGGPDAIVDEFNKRTSLNVTPAEFIESLMLRKKIKRKSSTLKKNRTENFNGQNSFGLVQRLFTQFVCCNTCDTIVCPLTGSYQP